MYGGRRTTRSITLAASLFAMSLPGCVFVGPRSICRVWADWNTYAHWSMNFERLDHLPYRRPRVETLHWQYGVGPNGPEPRDSDDLNPGQLSHSGGPGTEGCQSCQVPSASPVAPIPGNAGSTPMVPTLAPPVAAPNSPLPPNRAIPPPLPDGIRPLFEPPQPGGDGPVPPPPIVPMAYSIERVSAAEPRAAATNAPPRSTPRADASPTGAWLFQGRFAPRR